MKAPEKLYFGESDKSVLEIFSTKESNDEVEYTRTDAFIEKVCKWFDEHFEDIGLEWLRGYNASDVIEDFKKYMEE